MFIRIVAFSPEASLAGFTDVTMWLDIAGIYMLACREQQCLYCPCW
jgi:hypothetical protein